MSKIFVIVEHGFDTSDEGFYPISDDNMGVPLTAYVSQVDAEIDLVKMTGEAARSGKLDYYLNYHFCSEYNEIRVEDFNAEFPAFALENEEDSLDFKDKNDQQIWDVLTYINRLPYFIKEIELKD